MKNQKVSTKTASQVDTRTKVTVGIVAGVALTVIGSFFAAAFIIRTAHFLISR